MAKYNQIQLHWFSFYGILTNKNYQHIMNIQLLSKKTLQATVGPCHTVDQERFTHYVKMYYSLEFNDFYRSLCFYKH